MANGSTHRGPAKRDMILDQGSKHDAYLQRMIDQERRELPPYRAEMDSEAEITGNWKEGLRVKGRFPRWALGVLLLAVVALLLAVAWKLVAG